MLYLLKVDYIKISMLFTIACIGIAALLIGCPEDPADIVVDTTAPALSIQIGSISVSDGQVSFSLTNPNDEVVEGRIGVDPAPPSDAIYIVDGSIIKSDAQVSFASVDSDGATKQVQITQLNNGTEYTITITTFDTAGNAQSITDTTSQTPGIEYVCTNGVATGGIAAAENSERCTSCAAGYALSGTADAEGTVCAPSYICTNGVATDGIAAAAETEQCTSCATGYALSGTADAEGTVCAPSYICTNGVATDGIATTENTEQCTSCATGYALSGTADAEGTVCAPSYICTNGVATGGIAAAAETERCTSCAAGYALSGTADAEGTVCLARAYTCEHGSPTPGQPTTTNSQGCATCESKYHLSAAPGAGAACIENAYACENGTPIPGVPLNNGAAGCAECNTGYRLSTTAGADTTCLADTHGNFLINATSITLNTRIAGRINTTSDIDVFSFGVGSGRAFRVYTTGNTDTNGTVRVSVHSSGIVATDDDSGTNTNFDISTVNTSFFGQQYYVEVRGSEIGNYELVLEEILSTGSDLVIESASLSATSVPPGGSTTISVIVKNRGTGLSNRTTLRYYLSTNMTISTGDRLISIDTVSMLLPNGISTEEDYEVTTLTTASGTFYLGACVNAVAGETNTDNNCSDGVLVTILGNAPDITIDSISTSASTAVAAGTGITASATVKNIGLMSSASSTLKYYRSDNDYISDLDTEIGTADTIPILASQATSTQSTAIDTSGLRSGDYYIGVCVDAVAGETNTGNNCSDGVLVTILGNAPDLTIDSISTSVPTVAAGTGITASATVKNIGLMSSASSTLKYYRSTNDIISDLDTEIGTADTIPILASQATNAQSTTMDTSGLSGDYYIGVCVDAVAGETDTDNNCSDGVLLSIDNHGNTRVNATPVIDGSATTGRISPGDDVDYFAITVTGSGTLTASTTGYLDTVGRIRNSSDILLADNDDGGIDTNFLVSHNVTAGTYYIVVTSYGGDTGNYTLTVDFSDSYPYICTNGIPIGGTTTTANSEQCDSCNSMYALSGNVCVRTRSVVSCPVVGGRTGFLGGRGGAAIRCTYPTDVTCPLTTGDHTLTFDGRNTCDYRILQRADFANNQCPQAVTTLGLVLDGSYHRSTDEHTCTYGLNAPCESVSGFSVDRTNPFLNTVCTYTAE